MKIMFDDENIDSLIILHDLYVHIPKVVPFQKFQVISYQLVPELRKLYKLKIQHLS